VSKGLGSSQHTTGHCGDESFQTITCIATDNKNKQQSE